LAGAATLGALAAPAVALAAVDGAEFPHHGPDPRAIG
jgi:hypothetical protein